jgi:hypothetical protein
MPQFIWTSSPLETDLYDCIHLTLFNFLKIDRSFRFVCQSQRENIAVFQADEDDIESFLIRELRGAVAISPALFILVMWTDATISESITVNRRHYDLYAMVTATGDNSYCLYIRDGEGWLLIDNDRIVAIAHIPTDNFYLVGYIDQSCEPLDTFRIPLDAPIPDQIPDSTTRYLLKRQELRRSEMTFAETITPFGTKAELIEALR